MPTLTSALPTSAPTCGQLVTADGRTLPLQQTRLVVRAAGGVASVRLVQTFANPYREALHVRYQLPLPEIHLVEAAAAEAIGPWLSAMAQTPWFWQKITGIRQDPYGGLRLTTQSGTEILWGEPSVPKIAKKIYYLNQVLNDAAGRVGGVERADLRFFEEGRISVRPKKPGSI